MFEWEKKTNFYIPDKNLMMSKNKAPGADTRATIFDILKILFESFFSETENCFIAEFYQIKGHCPKLNFKKNMKQGKKSPMP